MVVSIQKHAISDDRPDKVRTGPLVFEDRLTEPSGSIDPQDALTVFNNPYASLNMKQQRARLPIYKVRILRVHPRGSLLET